MRLFLIIFGIAAVPYVFGQVIKNIMDSQLEAHEEWVQQTTIK